MPSALRGKRPPTPIPPAAAPFASINGGCVEGRPRIPCQVPSPRPPNAVCWRRAEPSRPPRCESRTQSQDPEHPPEVLAESRFRKPSQSTFKSRIPCATSPPGSSSPPPPPSPRSSPREARAQTFADLCPKLQTLTAGPIMGSVSLAGDTPAVGAPCDDVGATRCAAPVGICGNYSVKNATRGTTHQSLASAGIPDAAERASDAFPRATQVATHFAPKAAPENETLGVTAPDRPRSHRFVCSSRNPRNAARLCRSMRASTTACVSS